MDQRESKFRSSSKIKAMEVIVDDLADEQFLPSDTPLTITSSRRSSKRSEEFIQEIVPFTKQKLLDDDDDEDDLRTQNLGS